LVAQIHTVTFQGIEPREINVQVQLSSGLPSFQIVGLPDKAVGESRERVRAALHAVGLSLPPKRLTVNLAPADVVKTGSHFDLPIALGVLSAMGVLPAEELDQFCVLGELSLDGRITPVNGVLAAAMQASAAGRGLICPRENGAEGAWADIEVLAPVSLLALINHFKGSQVLTPPSPVIENADSPSASLLDLADVKGQETAKRALEIAAAGGHNMLMSGPPGSGKSMLASRMPSILPPLTAAEALDTSMIHSVAGQLTGGQLLRARPYRDPHHSASQPAMIGGGSRAQPGEISLAHNGVLFLDELPEFARGTLEALRQPLENGSALVSRVNYHVHFPADFQLIAAMNPCRCGHLDDAALACGRAPKCAMDYQAKISGPLFDRIDLHVEVPAVNPLDLANVKRGEDSATVRARVTAARERQMARFQSLGSETKLNAGAGGTILEQIAPLDEKGRNLLVQATEKMKLSARGYHRVLRVARTLADLEGADNIAPAHIAEAIGFRRFRPSQQKAA
tara:strand:+ start:75 stop:1607 length:1533 start_codon:yes stop_codon:yes gene_type:complete